MFGLEYGDVIGNVCHRFICPAEKGRCPITDLGENIDTSERTLIAAGGEKKPIFKTVVKTLLNGKEVLIESLVDISERKRIEDALRRSETKYRQLVENANDAIVVAQKGFLTLVNPRMVQMIGYSEEELRSRPFTEFIHPDDRDMVMGMHVRRTGGENPPSRYSFRLIHKDGDILWIEISSVVIDWEGSPASMNFLMDITERKQAEEALRESNRKLRLLTSLTRHDIFNQLSTIDLFQTMALESSDLRKIHECINHARIAGNRIETIIGFTREYEDFGVVSSGWKCISPLVESAADEVKPDGIIIENQIPEYLEVYVDPIIRKVFTTLIENAARHGINTKKIRFFCETSGEDLVIVCEDDGSGIPVTDKERIFEHGYGSHTGIGLFLSKEILSITGLSIQERGEYGHGARFEILVPSGSFRELGQKNII
jgi:PAS domain S-box-containing protein